MLDFSLFLWLTNCSLTCLAYACWAHKHISSYATIIDQYKVAKIQFLSNFSIVIEKGIA